MQTRESSIERKLTASVKDMGGRAYKFVSPGCDGVPDRLVLFPGKHIAFIEVKAPGKKLRPLQLKRKAELESMGFTVYILDDAGDIKTITERIRDGV